MPYLVRSIDLEDRKETRHTADTLENAVTVLAEASLFNGALGSENLRDGLRSVQVYTNLALGIWLEFSDGKMISLDPEDANHALSSPEARRAFEGGLQPLHQAHIPLQYRLRMLTPDDREVENHHPDLKSVFQQISYTWNYHAPHSPGFTHWLWRTQAEPYMFSLSACVNGNSAAVPLPLNRAETAFISAHSAIELELQLRNEIIGIP